MKVIYAVQAILVAKMALYAYILLRDPIQCYVCSRHILSKLNIKDDCWKCTNMVLSNSYVPKWPRMYRNRHVPKQYTSYSKSIMYRKPLPEETGGEGKGREMGEVDSVREGRAGDTDTAHAHSLRPMDNP